MEFDCGIKLPIKVSKWNANYLNKKCGFEIWMWKRNLPIKKLKQTWSLQCKNGGMWNERKREWRMVEKNKKDGMVWPVPMLLKGKRVGVIFWIRLYLIFVY